MTADPPSDPAALLARVHELEQRLEEHEDTIEAIRRGGIDAVVVTPRPEQYRIYTLETADQPYRVLIEQIQEGAITLGEDGTLLYCNRRLADLLGVAQERLVGQKLQQFVLPADQAAFLRLLVDAKQVATRCEMLLCPVDAVPVSVYISLSVLSVEDGASLLCGVVTDLTEQKLHVRELAEANAKLVAEIAERERIEESLRHAQKMEAVGQLTGGLAHDFNNLLTGIVAGLELLQLRLSQGRMAGIERYITAAMSSANRAAALTHRLLAFSRRQTLDPKLTAVNALVTGMEELLRRTVGPGISVETVLRSELWTTLCDPNQLESALLNLAINARDAMPEGGTLRIETANVSIEPTHAMRRDMAPGQYVTLAVTDNGTGMTPDVVERAFDPFFTTKPLGEGTGLGLSMIYGFAKQSGGQVRIHSEVGRGTTVTLYLPRHRGDGGPETTVAPRTAAARAEGDGETVLVVDDEVVIRMLIVELLEDLGYRVLQASDARSGMQQLERRPQLDLLVTDVGLPGGMNGRQFADAARQQFPDLKVLFITGYAASAAIGGAHLEPGMDVLTKPFTTEALAARIRKLLSPLDEDGSPPTGTAWTGSAGTGSGGPGSGG